MYPSAFVGEKGLHHIQQALELAHEVGAKGGMHKSLVFMVLLNNTTCYISGVFLGMYVEIRGRGDVIEYLRALFLEQVPIIY